MSLNVCAAGVSKPSLVVQFEQMMRWMLRQSQNSWWVTLLLWLVAIAPAQAELEFRVAIEQDMGQIKVGSSTDAVLRDAAGHILADIPAMNAVVAEAKDGKVSVNQLQTSQLWIEPSSEAGYVFIGERWYRGRTLVVPTSGGITAVNYVDLEQYLYSVVGAEMPANWSLEALKAQAVAARSYALYQRQHSANTVFDVGDTTTWQVYGGLAREAPTTRAAVDATKGQVLTYQGQIINAVFHSCAGGYTENVEDVWSNPLPYLRGVPSPDQDFPECQWSPVTFTVNELGEQLGYEGTISSLEVQRHAHGRVMSVIVDGSDGVMTIEGDDVRDRLGLKSTLFTVTSEQNRVASTANVPTASRFQFSGSGNGHGIGLSQYGAYKLAQQSWNYQQILLHYYTSVALAKIQVQ